MSKKTGRFNLRGMIYDPLPPPENSRDCTGLLLVLLGEVAYKISGRSRVPGGVGGGGGGEK